MKKFFNYAISGLLLGVLLCSSLGIVQGGNSTSVHGSDLLAVSKVDLPLASATSISAGSFHTCAITTEGGVRCWGNNPYGQLGNGETTNSSIPVDVDELTSVVKEVSEGSYHTCVLTSDGGVKCWGYNYIGQLGNGTTDDSLTPVDVSGLTSGVKEISAGGSHNCAVNSKGGVMCWGNNGSGQLGYDTAPDTFSKIPELVSGLESGVVAVSAGDNHTCAITSEGGVKCWGNNGDGQLGYDTTPDNFSNTPELVSGLESGVEAVSLGESHTCALTSGGAVKCWGYNVDGQLGNGTTDDSLTPVDVIGLTSGVKAISGGGSHNCALTDAGGIMCWGDNDSGQLGDGSTTDQHTPLLVNELSIGIKEVSAGSYHTCALTSGGTVKCWGDNEYGQLGDGTTMRVTTPVDVIGLDSGMEAVSADFQYTCALTDSGGVKCWGDKYNGVYGDWMNTSSSNPVDVDGLTSGVKAISTGQYHTCVITATNGVKCWGFNGYGQLGDETYNNSLTPVDVFGFTDDGEDAIAISAGDDHTCILTSAGGVKCWGSNNFYQLGVDRTTTLKSNIPVPVIGFANEVTKISAGANHTCVITTEDEVKCWGDNQFGKLGDGTTTPSFTPVIVEESTDVNLLAVEISAGKNHTCAITTTSGVKCWGYNYYGQLGDGTTTEHHTPIDVFGLTSGVKAISAGYQHTCAITTTGEVKCWGDNYYGQLGDGTTTEHHTPIDVFGLTSGVKAVSTGTSHTCALTSADGIKCWGDNTHGQLGWKLLWVPVDVIGFVDAPIANAGDDQVVNTLSTVTLNGSGTDPNNATPLTYKWTQTGGTSVTLNDPTAASPTFTAPGDPTTLTFSLVVKDSLMVSSSADEVNITVNNQAPNANAGEDQSVDTLSTVTLDGSGSDPDNDLALSYLWTQTGGTSVTLNDPTAASPTFTAPDNPTTLIFSLVVKDSWKVSSSADEVTITVNNQAPTANAGEDQSVNTLSTVTLNGSGTDPDNDEPFYYLWTQTGGTSVTLNDPTAANPTFTAPDNPTTLTFSLVVKDSWKVSSSADEVTITVNNQAPVEIKVYLPLLTK